MSTQRRGVALTPMEAGLRTEPLTVVAGPVTRPSLKRTRIPVPMRRRPRRGAGVLDQFTAHGTPRQVRDQLAGWDGAVDLAMIGLPPGLPWVAVEATLRAAAPARAAQ